jgi:excisionase family DNA binding protein
MSDYLSKLTVWHSDVQSRAKELAAVVRSGLAAGRHSGAISQTQQAVEARRTALMAALQAMPRIDPEPLLNGGRPFTVDTLAARWEVSADHIRQLVKSGKLPYWRLGDKLIRIKPETVVAVERGEISLE